MNDLEKAKEISTGFSIEKLSTTPIQCCKESALEMAQWKDEQFNKKLQEIVDYVYPLICGGERLHINEIIGKDMVWKH